METNKKGNQSQIEHILYMIILAANLFLILLPFSGE